MCSVPIKILQNGKTLTVPEAMAWIGDVSGGWARLADEIGVSRQCVWEWTVGLRPIPKRREEQIKIVALSLAHELNEHQRNANKGNK